MNLRELVSLIIENDLDLDDYNFENVKLNNTYHIIEFSVVTDILFWITASSKDSKIRIDLTTAENYECDSKDLAKVIFEYEL